MMDFNMCFNFRQFDADKQRLRNQISELRDDPDNLEEYFRLRDELNKLMDFQEILLHYWM